MGTDYETKRKITRRRMLEICGIGGGMALMMGGISYKILATPSMPPSLARKTEIERKLKRSLEVSLENLERESPSLMSRKDVLEAERDKITSDQNFAKVRDKYESERDKVSGIFNYSLFGGAAIYLLALGSLYIKSLKRTQPHNSEDQQPIHTY